MICKECIHCDLCQTIVPEAVREGKTACHMFKEKPCFVEITTYHEIVKALKDMGSESEVNFSNGVLALINHLNAEIERLRAKCEKRTQEKLELGRIYTHKLKTANAEIESLTKKYKMAVAEREANVKGFTAEIERLNLDYEKLQTKYENVENELKYQKRIYENGKAEAVKECTEKLKSLCGEWIYSLRTDDIFKEMAGDENGQNDTKP